MKKKNITLYLWILLSITALLRLFVIGQIGLGDDEAHYFAYSQNLQASYFDHPPAIGYIIRFFTLIFGINEFAVRLPAVLLFFFTSLFIFLLAKDLFNEEVAFWSVALINIMPVFSFLGAVLTVPDAPLAFFWVLYIYFFWKAINPVPKLVSDEDGKYHFSKIWVKKERIWPWYAMGIVLGFGLLSKYNMILLVPSMFLFLFVSKYKKAYLKNIHLYISLVIAFIVFLPVILWNLQNNFASFGYQLKHGFGKESPSFSFALLGKCLGAQAGYVSPFLFLFFWFVIFWLACQYLKQRILVFKATENGGKGFMSYCMRLFSKMHIPVDIEYSERFLFIFCFSFPTLFIFNAIASFNEILPHWPATGYLILSIGVTYFIIRTWTPEGRILFKSLVVASCALALFLTVLVPMQAMYKVLSPEMFMPQNEANKIEDGIKKAEKVDVTNELYGWDTVGKIIRLSLDVIARECNDRSNLSLNDKIASLLSVARNDKMESHDTSIPGYTCPDRIGASGVAFIFTFRHYLASQLSFYVPGNPKIYCLSERIDAYDFWQRELSALDGKDAIFVSNSRFYLDPTKFYPFESWEKLEPVEVFRKGRKIRIFYLWRGRNFNLKKLDANYTSDILAPKVTWKQGLKELDHAVFWVINRDMRSRFLDYIMRFFSFIGNGIPLGILVGLVLWFGKRENFLKEFLIAIGVLLIGGAIVHVLKDYFARVRPLTLWGDSVHVLGEKLYRCAFPSGHSQASFSAATFLTTRFKRFWWVFYLCALLVAISRIYLGAHFPLDVIAGSLVGITSAGLLLYIIDK
ncbi:MAG: glycosyltransferase family 39 protein [Endomicrobiales bacterium]|nr:glycosyltransferase family 39 protein [Endomicrobiales bacterium]